MHQAALLAVVGNTCLVVCTARYVYMYTHIGIRLCRCALAWRGYRCTSSAITWAHPQLGDTPDLLGDTPDMGLPTAMHHAALHQGRDTSR